VTVFGENRIQEARQKIPLCPGHLEWHLVGHLQRNKVRDAISLFHMLHSIDSLRLLETVDRICGDVGKRLPVCLQVNVSGESSKFGMPPEAVEPTLEAAAGFMNVDVEGLMTIPPFTEDPEGARPVFRALRDLRDRTRDRTGVELEALSMGMSNDFDVAIEEGATWIRVGTLLFGERERRIQE
jgi:pyridoxal phosphate enzyme (YggS family)